MKTYKVRFSYSAAVEMRKSRRRKADLLGRDRANRWYQELKREIKQELCFMPEKYRVREMRDHPEIEARLAMFNHKRDVVLYTINEDAQAVEVLHVLPKGNNALDS